MTSKVVKCLSVRLSVWCQHFQNPKAMRPLGRRRWSSARIICGSGDTS